MLERIKELKTPNSAGMIDYENKLALKESVSRLSAKKIFINIYLIEMKKKKINVIPVDYEKN